MTVRITYSSGRTVLVRDWTPEMIDRLRASWAEIREPKSTATIEEVPDAD